MKKIIIVISLALITVIFIYFQSRTDSNFDHFKEPSNYKPTRKEKRQQEGLPFGKTRIQTPKNIANKSVIESDIEFITDDRVIKSCNLILKSKLSIFKKLDSFLSTPCKEVASQKIWMSHEQDTESLNWIKFYQSVSTGLGKLTFDQKEILKHKLIVQLSSPGNLLQTKVLTDVLITIMSKNSSSRIQEIEKLNEEMSADVAYLRSATVGLEDNDPERLEIMKQEVAAIERFQRQFRLIMDIK